MPWHCPACSTVIRHSDTEDLPSVNERYRCHVCRLSLNFSDKLRKLVIEDFEADHYVEPAEPERAKSLPAPLQSRQKARRRLARSR